MGVGSVEVILRTDYSSEVYAYVGLANLNNPGRYTGVYVYEQMEPTNPAAGI